MAQVFNFEEINTDPSTDKCILRHFYHVGGITGPREITNRNSAIQVGLLDLANRPAFVSHPDKRAAQLVLYGTGLHTWL